MTRWTPNTTVATLVFDQGRFLLVEELDRLDGRDHPVLNQPAGHLEADESLVQAACRETLEETGWQVTITGYLGLYINQAPNQVIYHRHAFIAKPERHDPDWPLDEGILGCHWMSLEELESAERQNRLRSAMVLPACRDFLAGTRFPLSVIQDFRF